jgi:excinuclease ABC subunit A
MSRQSDASATADSTVTERVTELDHIIVRGAREHNLKGLDLEIPKKKLVVFTGVSGSGKSSLAFDTLFAEGQRRYVESLSAYARQFLGQMEKPHYDSIRGLSPTISIEQKAASKNPRSTVGTITEIYDYLRVLYARVGEQRCHACGRSVEPQTAQQIVEELTHLPEGTKFVVLAPVVEHRKGEHKELLDELRGQGYARLRVDGEMIELDEKTTLDKKRRNRVDVVIDRLVARPEQRPRLTDSVEAALRRGDGKLIVSVVGERDDRLFSENRWCAHCGLGFPELSPQSFSFNSPLGMCRECNGLGTALEIDPGRVVPDPALSINGGAIKPWRTLLNHPAGSWTKKILEAVALTFGIDLDAPWSTLAPEHQQLLLVGSGEREIELKWRRGHGTETFATAWEGVLPTMMRRWRDATTEEARLSLAAYFSNAPCRACKGTRLRPESAAVQLGGRSILEINGATIAEAHRFLSTLALSGARGLVAAELTKEICGRLRFLLNVGLEYLSLDRPGPSLSGGESQRIRLASQMGSELTGVLYILDEPSIGLHPRDNRRLISTLEHLRDLGNSVLVVEHDEEIMTLCDFIVDFGPGAGRLGGEIIVSGTPEVVRAHPTSLTAAYLSGRRQIELPERRRTPDPGRQVRIRNARANNLRGVDAAFPIGLFTCVTGVSGAGKSTLVNDILLPAAARALNGANEVPGPHDGLTGLEHLDKVIDIDQSPIGRTPRSNPATYTKMWDDIREVFASTREAKAYGFGAGRFSFNVKGGRCERCEGRRRDEGRDALPRRRLCAVRGVQGTPVQRRDASCALPRPHHQRDPRHHDRRRRRTLPEPPEDPTRPADASGRRARLSATRPTVDDALRGRGAAHQAEPRALAHGHRPNALHPRRALHRPALRGHPTAARGRAAPRRDGQHGGHDRAQPRHHQDGRLGRRSGARGRRGRRSHAGGGHARAGRGHRREPHGPVPAYGARGPVSAAH